MTEAAFQACRKVMQRANYRRGQITKAEANVAKWTAFEQYHRTHLHESQADGAAKNVEKAIKRLEEERQRFADLLFPDNNLAEAFSRCKECGSKTEYGIEYCGYDMCIKEFSN